MELIDKNELLKYKVVGTIGNVSGDFVAGMDIDRIPVIDAVQVVRCKNCRASEVTKTGNTVYCMAWERIVSKNGYCSYGESR